MNLLHVQDYQNEFLHEVGKIVMKRKKWVLQENNQNLA